MTRKIFDRGDSWVIYEDEVDQELREDLEDLRGKGLTGDDYTILRKDIIQRFLLRSYLKAHPDIRGE